MKPNLPPKFQKEPLSETKQRHLSISFEECKDLTEREISCPYCVMCLCPKCREMFFSIPGCVIKRVDKEQEAKDNCSYCTVRLGFDYYVCEKPKKAIFTNCDFHVEGTNQKIAPLAD